jgi:hypothetical protein
MEERDLPNILANYCCDLLDWACEQGLTKDEAFAGHAGRRRSRPGVRHSQHVCTPQARAAR